MANKQISQLTSASTPLAGTEVLPIVQSGATVKVSAANITAGRDVNVRTILATVADGSYPIGVSGTTKGVRVLTDANATSIQGVDSTLAGSYQPLALGGLELRLQSNGATDRWWLDSGGNLVQKTAAKGVNFTANTPAAGMTSQLLNWYEEGTWTPVPTPVSGSITSYTSTGRYTRIGNQVTVALRLDITNVGTAAALLNIAGLPFTSSSAASVSAGAFKEVGATGDDWTLYVTPSTTVLAGRTYNNGNAIATGYIFYGSCTYFTA